MQTEAVQSVRMIEVIEYHMKVLKGAGKKLEEIALLIFLKNKY